MLYRLTALRLGVVLLSTCCVAHSWSDEPPKPDELLFVRHVLPIFRAKCFACHGDDPQDIRGDLDMRTRAGLLQGGESGMPTLVPAEPESSPLIEAIRWEGLEMPPKENDRLTAAQIKQIEHWVRQGAVWPNDTRLSSLEQEQVPPTSVDEVLIATSGGLSSDWSNRTYPAEGVWAYQPLDNTARLSEHQSLAEAIDDHIDRQIAERDLTAAGDADRHTLIRRATYDLIGLPPTPDEVASFVDDP
ncbi:MAG: DUF1549 domain-containing protein, partial [Planctomycetales bacterium]|nr:DUF1549 domain-containing protein [Planctomycetales bacterium]